MKTRKVKRIMAFCLAAATVFAVAGCGEKEDSSSKSTETTEVTTTEIAETSTSADKAEIAETTLESSSAELQSSVAEVSSSEDSSSQIEENVIEVSSDWRDMEFVLDGEKIKIGETTVGDLHNTGWIIPYAGMESYDFFEVDFSNENLDLADLWWSSDTIIIKDGYNTVENYSLRICTEVKTSFCAAEDFRDKYTSAADVQFNDFSVEVVPQEVSHGNDSSIHEFTLPETRPNVIVNGDIRFGSSVDEVVESLGEPARQYTNSASNMRVDTTTLLYTDLNPDNPYDFDHMLSSNEYDYLTIVVSDGVGVTKVTYHKA